MKQYLFISLCAGLGFCFSSCSPQSLHEAQTIVAQADSLRAEGQLYTDSAQLASAYATLDKWQVIYPDAYAHACYHYGRLLRAKDNPVPAMECFINATHSHTHDYHILGRVYSNMGSICHLAGEYDISYNMYEYSAEMFLKNGDTLLYYYLLNDMAVELSEQGKKEETLTLISIIQQQCSDSDVVRRTYETTADLYRITEAFDSAVYWINQTERSSCITPLGIIIKAQCFYRLGVYDSALYYAWLILADSLSIYQDKFNAIYIISHCDSSLCSENIRQMASQREDIRYYEYEPEKEKLTTAVQLLEQDLKRKPDLRWAYAILGTLAVIGTCICLYVHQSRKRHALLTQRIGDLEQTATTIQQKHEKLREVYTENYRRIENEILGKCELLRNSDNIVDELKWHNFAEMCHVIDCHFYILASKLRQKNILNETEIRLCVLVLIDFSRSQIADILPYAANGVGKFKYRVAQKLGTEGKKLRKYLISLAINGHSEPQ